METRANFVVIGAFTLGAVVGGVSCSSCGSPATARRARTDATRSSSTARSPASPRERIVLFNGLKVGEVTNLGFVKGNPSQVVADIDVTNASAPINSDTKAQLETQGLTGSATVALIGGEKGAGELAGNPPVIPSLPTATLADLQTKAGYVLDLANKLLVDNAQPIHQTIENVQTFSMALADNSAGVDARAEGHGRSRQDDSSRWPRACKALSDDADKLVKAIEPDKVRMQLSTTSQVCRQRPTRCWTGPTS